MRFKTFLEHDAGLADLGRVYKEIQMNCQPFLKAAGDKPLYRGMDDRGMDSLTTKKLPHPINRMPRDSDESFNFFFNAMMELGTGIQNGRRSSLFVTPEEAQARPFGDLHFCFPAGPVEVMWSAVISDSMESNAIFTAGMSGTISYLTGAPMPNLHIAGTRLSHMFRMLDEVTTPHKWLTDGAQILTPDKFDTEYLRVLFGDSIDDPEKMHQFCKTAMTRVFETCYHFGGTDEITRALKERNEILLTKTNGYYMIPVDVLARTDYADVLEKIKNA